MNMNEENTARLERPCIRMMHPNTKKSGSMLVVKMNPAHGEVEGRMEFTLLPQDEGKDGLPCFSNQGISMSLTSVEVAMLLEVLRGYCESLCEGRGIFHRCADVMKKMTFQHTIEPIPGYIISMYAKDMHITFHLNLAEALVLSEAMASSLVYMAFGFPVGMEG